MPLRLDKVNSLVRSEVGKSLARLLVVPDAIVTVTAVETSPDLRHAAVWISVVPEDDGTVWRKIEAAVPGMQAHLAQNLKMKRTPRLSLKLDRGGVHARHIEDILDTL